MARTFQFEDFRKEPDNFCEGCEAMLTDALDGALGEVDQAWFDRHIASCDACAAMLADAQRGAAWLELLKSPRPEPSADLLERILTRTAGAASNDLPEALPAPAPIFVPAPAPVIPFRPRRSFWALPHGMLEPRLAMTAAMAFFSLALTMNLTGLQLRQLSPSSLRKAYYQTNADISRYYANLRLVREFESQVQDLRDNSTPDAPDGNNGNGQPEKKGSEPGPGVSQTRPAPASADLISSTKAFSGPAFRASRISPEGARV